ncbi:sensor domain-containing diguanylate cyclase [Vreelandella populi]|uniref:Diguanylate cyclase n=1 Tax=Vreelandella populi TaxID=2498858 RepID=A0A3S0YYI7_9GAMM|nr:diguanylate cyclase [Halomonas populi]RUR42417.1 diguanylate cyclase [Halomonas populi]RUR45978.1 diguanylate cyclase [Halomonas populi]
MPLSFPLKKLRSFRTLKGRLLLGLLATLLILVALLLGLAWQVGKTMVLETNMTHLRYEARLLADEITQQVELRIQALQRLDEIAGYSDDPEWLSYELRHSDTLMVWFDGIVVAGRDGHIIADWPSIVGRVGLDISNTEFFKMVRGTRQPHMSEPFIGRASKSPMVVVSVPRINDDGEFAGMIGGVLSLDTGGLFNRLAKVRLGERGFAGVATASGTILYHPNSSLINTHVVNAAANPLLDQALDGWQGDGVGNLLSDQIGLQSYAQVWPANWVIGLYLPREQAQLPLAGFIRKLGWMWLLLAILIMPFLGWILARILTPLNHLETQIGEVGRGERQRVTLATAMQELRQVASTFNHVEGERQTLVANLQERQAFLDSVLSAAPQGMFVANFDGAITYMNPALLGMLNIPSDWTMEALLNQIHSDDRDGARDMWRYSLKNGSDFVRQLRFTRLDGEALWLDIHARVVMLTQEGLSLGFVGVVKDITERREQEALQRWEAEHDPLTGLLNRRGFERRLEEAFADFQKTSTPSALVMFDLDHFKPINDEGGHALGDEMLRRIAQVVAWGVRRSDHVARQGGDEFGVLLPSCTLAQAQLIAESLRQAVSEVSVSHLNKEYRVTLSIGVTSFNDSDTRIEEVLSRADAASYEAKGQGRDGVVTKALSEQSVPTLFK